jgi:hypothetical protein
MPGWLWTTLLILVAVVALYLSNTAGRLDRLHHRVEASRTNMEHALARRRDVSELVVASGLIDPASGLLIDDAVAAVDSVATDDDAARALAESNLTAVLDAVFADPIDVDAIVHESGGEVVQRLADQCRRVEIGRRFYNDAVFATTQMRQRPVVRWFRLQGTAALPTPFEMNDEMPTGFAPR